MHPFPRWRWRLLGQLACLLLLLGLGPPLARAGPAPFGARVVRVVDGDTLVVAPDEPPETREAPPRVRIRLAGIDTPEMAQPFGKKAKQYASSLAAARHVRIVPTTRDRYGRIVAEVLLADGRSLNRALVAAGLAWWYRKYAPKDALLERLEGEARRERLGLWSQGDPIPPWQWRRERRKKAGRK